ncbi:hypothetical protein SNE40_022568 [Patella caerulea]|uniref:BHLH domain-containing protein n=1 Tax=Patella caerulea TaxID=87958 RepID=A0AAN8FWU1_PATCE
MESYFFGLEEDLLDFCDSVDYGKELDSPCSNESDLENQFSPNDTHFIKPNGKRVHQRRAANLRERKRMKSINDAFENLRTCIPATVHTERRLSKVDTLRLAIRYISYLSNVVHTCNEFGGDSNNNKSRPQEKIILRCHYTDSTNEEEDGTLLLGHSLSWQHDHTEQKIDENKYSAKVWVPEGPTESDIINLSTYSSEYL